MEATVAAPADADEMCRTYLDYVKSLVLRGAIPPRYADDVTAEIMTRLLERNVLGMFDPAHVIIHEGKQVPPNFKSFLTAQVLLYIRGQRDKLGRHGFREILLCDTHNEGGASWLEMFGGAAWWDDYSGLSARDFVDRMRTYLAMVPPRSHSDTCNLVALFDELVAEIQKHGQVMYPELQERFGVSYTTACSWVARLRRVMREAGDAPAVLPEPPVVGGITLSLADIHAALRILRHAKGIMVRQPLDKADHPLAKAEKGWYHDFSRGEIELFPELAIDPGTHKKPAGHVKLAVIHRLERMLAGQEPPEPEPVPEPELAVTPLDELEAELWSAGKPAAWVDRCLELARSVAVA